MLSDLILKNIFQDFFAACIVTLTLILMFARLKAL